MCGAFRVWNATTSFHPFSRKRTRVSCGVSVIPSKGSLGLKARRSSPATTVSGASLSFATPGCDCRLPRDLQQMVSQLPGFERRTLLQADSCQRSAVRCDQTFSALKVAQSTEPHLDFFYVVTREGLGDLLRLMHGDYLSQDVRSV